MKQIEISREIFANKDAFSQSKLNAHHLPIEHFVRIETPPSGGVYAHWLVYRFPTKGFPFANAVNANNSVKKLLFGVMQVARTMKYLLAIFFFLPKKYRKKIMLVAIEQFVIWADWVLYDVMLEPKRFCGAVREIYLKTSMYLDAHYTGSEHEIYMRFLRVVCTVFDYDSGYKYPAQDVFMEVDKANLRKNPSDEMQRLFQILMSRDRRGAMDMRYMTVLKLFGFIAKFRKSWWKKVMDVVDTIEIGGDRWEDVLKYDWNNLQDYSEKQQVGFDHGDWYHALGASQYDFGGVSFDSRWRIRRKLDEAWMKKMQKEGRVVLREVVQNVAENK